MAGVSCGSCGAPMALADTLCHACGAPAPKDAQAAVFLARAEAAAGAEDWVEAARQMERALPGLTGSGRLAGALKRLGQWQEKSAAQGLPSLEDAAEASFRRAREADDADALAHQLWINNLVRRGLDARAQRYYEDRLAAEPGDLQAAAQLKVLKLARDFKARPVAVKLDLGAPGGRLASIFAPSPWKLAMLGGNTLASALGMLASLLYRGKAAETMQAAGEIEAEVGSKIPSLDTLGLISDPWTWAFGTAVSGGLWWWMWRSRR